jgi:hypothetical protein
MNLQETERGWLFVEFTDLNGSQCSFQESSLATEAAIWLGIDKDFEGIKTRRMHLSQEQVIKLLPLLTHFAAHGVLPDTVINS